MAEAVAVKEKAQVPALVNTPALEIEADDVELPRLYIGQYMSEAVKKKLVSYGDIFVANGKDDDEPQVLEQPVKFHVVAMRKGKSLSEDGELETWAFDDPEADPKAWTTYNYVITLPGVDTDGLPVKWLLSRTGRPAAKQINGVLKKNEGRGPAWVNAFEVTTSERTNKKGDFNVAKVRPVDADEDDVKFAENIAIQISGQQTEQTTDKAPAI